MATQVVEDDWDQLEPPRPATRDEPEAVPAPPPNRSEFARLTGRDVVIAPAARQPEGALTGRIVYMSAGHGWTANQDDSGTRPGNWFTQRGDNNEIVEDLGNIDQMTMYAVHCFNAGATVVPMRPVGFQSNEVVLDNDDPGVVFTPDASWTNSSATVFYGDPGDIPYLFASKDTVESATARYTPNIPEAGLYPVYAWTRAGSDRVDDQLYRISHTGGVTEVRVNHRMVGNGWVYLGTYYLEAGTGGWAEISNLSSSAQGSLVFADAIRFGNGMGDIDRGGGVSGHPREDEGSRYWVQASIGQGGASFIYDSSSTDQNDNVSAPSRMAANMNRSADSTFGRSVYLGFHSNASPGSLGLFNGNNNPAASTPNQFRWAELVGRELNDDLVAIGSPPLEEAWTEQGPNPGDVTLDRSDIEFGEIRGDRTGNEFDATIIETGGHVGDDINLRNPRARNWIARACLQATVRYFNEFHGGPLAMLPEPPGDVRAVADGSGNVVLSWEQSAVDGIGGDAATGYVVCRSSNGYGFGAPVTVAGGSNTSAVISDAAPGETVHFRVAATNAGGESLPSMTVAVRLPSPGALPPVLIVNGFDRFDRTLNPRETASGIGGGGTQTYDRVKPRLSNSFDYVVQVAQAVDAFGLGFDSCQNESITRGEVDLTDYDAVLWILGEESTADEAFSASEQALVTAHLNQGGHLFLSGAEIAWDLDRPSGPTAADRAFLNDRLHADFVGDDANTYTVASSAGGIFAGNATLQFDDGTSGQYNADFPDRLAPSGLQAVAAMTYSGGSGDTAAIQDSGDFGSGRVVFLGFPFETILDESDRAELMSDVLTFFGLATPAGVTVR